MPGFEHDQAWFGQSRPRRAHRAPSRTRSLARPPRSRATRRKETRRTPRLTTPRLHPPSCCAPPHPPRAAVIAIAFVGFVWWYKLSQVQCHAPGNACSTKRLGPPPSDLRRPTVVCAPESAAVYDRRAEVRLRSRFRSRPPLFASVSDPRALVAPPAFRRTRLFLGSPVCARRRRRKCDADCPLRK